jgi:hypothetical protein
MFYEGGSGFFYDRKSKLYYGTSKGAYFRYDATKTPPFELVADMAGAASAAQGETSSQLPYVNTTITPTGVSTDTSVNIKMCPLANEGKKTIKIKLHTTAKNVGKRTASVAQKQQASNIEKWSKRSIIEKQDVSKARTTLQSVILKSSPPTATAPAEQRIILPLLHESAPFETKMRESMHTTVIPLKRKIDSAMSAVPLEQELSASPPQAAAKASVSDKKQKERDIVKTKSGEPICALCMRRFPSIEKLRLHEIASALHKDNLAKRAALEKQNAAVATATAYIAAIKYEDRAKKRRDIHGHYSLPPPRLHVETPAVPINMAVPQDILGSDNIGNQLFQKMLQKSDSATKDQAGQEIISSNLRKDWERIESLAMQSGERQHRGHDIGGAGLGRDEHYHRR